MPSAVALPGPDAPPINTRSRSHLIVGLPLLFMLVLVTITLVNRLQFLYEMNRTVAATSVMISISELIYQLQVERGLTAAHLGSAGPELAARLSAQRQASDEASAILAQEMAEAAQSIQGTLLQDLIASASTGMDDIATMRARADSKSIDALSTTTSYAAVIDDLLNFARQFLPQAATVEVVRPMLAFVNLVQAKEFAGIERALIVSALSENGISLQREFNFYAANQAKQTEFLERFHVYADAAQQQLFADKVRGAAIDEVERIQQTILEQQSVEGLDVDPLTWFQLASDRMNLMHDVETSIAWEIQTKASTEATRATIGMSLILILAIGVSLIAFTAVRSQRRQEQDLVRACAESDRANRAKSEFLSNMSHELRTPLNAVLGFAQLMELDEQLPQEHVESVQHILKGGNHLLALINDVLQLAKIESGQKTLSLEPVNLAALVDECIALTHSIALKCNVSVSGEGLERMVVRADRVRLRQALLNLLSNAIKYNRQGGTVTITVAKGPQNRLRLQVTDNGPGIAAARMNELFLPFNRLGKETSGIEGTGIGLTIARQVVELMGGTVDAESTEAVGSTFWIELPRDLTGATTGTTAKETAAEAGAEA